MTLRVTVGDVAVIVRGDAVEETTPAMERLTYDGVPAALMAGNASLWGPDAAERAAGRLGWVGLPETARRLLPELAELRERTGVSRTAVPAGAAPPAAAGPGPAGEPDGRPRVVLVGTGGPAAAAQAMARAAGAEPTVLDTPDPGRVRRLIDAGLGDTVLVVADDDGATAEIDALHRVFGDAFRAAGADPAERIIVVTRPGSPLAAAAREAGRRVVPSDPAARGGFAALTAGALVPAALWGVDVAAVLDEAAGLSDALRRPYDNPGLALGAALGAAAAAGHDRLVLAGAEPGRPALAGWVEHLLAVALGKDARGVLPVVAGDATGPEPALADDVRRVVLGAVRDDAELAVSGPVGAQFLLWQFAVALAARLTGVDPFDDPGVREARADVAALMRGADDGSPPTLVAGEPLLVDDAVEVHGDAELLRAAKDLTGVVDALVGAVPERGYLAVTAYLDPAGDAAAAGLRGPLARRTAAACGAPVTFGWGPRTRHGAGQYHRCGPPSGVFLQITGAAGDIPVPGRPYGLRALQLAQAFADLRALRARGRPAVRLHLRDRAAGLARLADVLGG